MTGQSQPKSDILAQILRHKVEEISIRQRQYSLRQISQDALAAITPRGFCAAIERRVRQGQVAVIAEMKKASPSKGLLRRDYNPLAIAKDYADNGACCLSVLTDERFFQGSIAHLPAVAQACDLPVLRKDFVIDPYQVYEARVSGADCILLIMAAAPDNLLAELSGLAVELAMDVLLEVHNAAELERALKIPARLIGVNNRDLHSFETRIETTLDLQPLLPDDRILISESGIDHVDQVAQLRRQGVHGFLVGEAFMRARQPGLALRELFFSASV